MIIKTQMEHYVEKLRLITGLLITSADILYILFTRINVINIIFGGSNHALKLTALIRLGLRESTFTTQKISQWLGFTLHFFSAALLLLLVVVFIDVLKFSLLHKSDREWDCKVPNKMLKKRNEKRRKKKTRKKWEKRNITETMKLANAACHGQWTQIKNVVNNR